uniref:Uncharacterized protein n=1 Tax=Anguilla anguilla TaxID=7936 RepID=A0A0E9VM35_ANGAN
MGFSGSVYEASKCSVPHYVVIIVMSE